jgi:hypothetical protein
LLFIYKAFAFISESNSFFVEKHLLFIYKAFAFISESNSFFVEKHLLLFYKAFAFLLYLFCKLHIAI